MPKPRKRQVSLNETPYYHCISRCVRRAFLCGKDERTGFDFEHRRQWIVDRIKFLCSVFAVDLCAYAVMSNHYHLVIRINQDQVAAWSNRQVAERWLRIFKGPSSIRHFLSGDELSTHERDQVSQLLTIWRQRLCNISWFMRCINEPIARMANAEDQCKGRFWEGRFTSQALLDERALLACMAYVDLNPIRAALASTPEDSEFTSIKERLEESHDSPLLVFSGQDQAGIPYSLEDYLVLVDWSGRAIRKNKRGHIPDHFPPILERLRMEASPFLDYLTRKEPSIPTAIGPISMLRSFARSIGQHFIKGHSLGKVLYPESA